MGEVSVEFSFDGPYSPRYTLDSMMSLRERKCHSETFVFGFLISDR